MVAKITIPYSIRRALNYNEQKVKEGMANCIYAHNFLKEASGLNFYDKLTRFENLIALNKRASTNTVHISLNFALDEKLEREKLSQIASAYMENIGFSHQPYLVYQHLDAGHPHIHIVTTNIQKDGKRISLHNIGRDKSEKARKELEIAFKLQKADCLGKADKVTPLNAQKLAYGASATKRGIINVLDAVLPRYKYASLAELNAILKLYNVTADGGKEEGFIYQKRGLYYRVLDSKGNKIGVPVKASSIYNNPTLSYLEKRFAENAVSKQQFKKNLKTCIDWIMVKPPQTLEAFKQALEKEKISLIVRQNEAGLIYGLTYIDHNTKSIFNGSEIGKQYSAKAILERCGVSPLLPMIERQLATKTPVSKAIDLSSPDSDKQPGLTRMLDTLITPVEQHQNVPFELRKQKRKKRKPQ